MRKNQSFTFLPLRLSARDRADLEELAEMQASSMSAAARYAIRRALQNEKINGAGLTVKGETGAVANHAG